MSSFNENPSSISPRSSAAVGLRRSGYPAPGASRLAGPALGEVSRSEKVALLRDLLAKKIHGISFSPYLDGQSPGTEISPRQIADRLSVIAPFTRWVRSFSCLEGNQEIPRIAHEAGLKTMVGVGLSEELDKNEEELANGIAVAQAGHADILAVGNEVLLRGDLEPAQIIEYMQRAREAAPGVPVSYVDAYFLFEDHPEVADACDLLLVNCYPFWESCPAEHALVYMKEMYRRALAAARGKPVVISETGWPSAGTAFGGAEPSMESALDYLIRTCQWADEEGIDIFYFSSFDETWKTGDEGDVGAYWGIWDSQGNLKYV